MKFKEFFEGLEICFMALGLVLILPFVFTIRLVGLLKT